MHTTGQYCFGDTNAAGSCPARASPYGALDMGGNVWEWVDDWWQPDYYSVPPGSNPMGPATGSLKVHRGAGWCCYGGALRVASREGKSSPTNLSYGVGIRCASTAGG